MSGGDESEGPASSEGSSEGSGGNGDKKGDLKRGKQTDQRRLKDFIETDITAANLIPGLREEEGGSKKYSIGRSCE